MVGNILKQQKRPHKKVQIDLELLDDPQVPGDRQANLWLCYDPSKAPQNEADWNEPRFVHKTHYGYYKWPPKMEVYAASTEQPSHNRSVESLSAGEQEIHKFFSNATKVDKLIEYLSLEEHKGHDRFDARRFIMFKGLFRNHGDAFMELFKGHLERLVDQDQESAHRYIHTTFTKKCHFVVKLSSMKSRTNLT